MTREEIMQMGRQAGSFIELAQEKDLLWLERFAKLVAQHTLSNIDPSKFMSYQEGFEAGRLAEREACAKWLEDVVDAPNWADVIRARGQA